MSFPKTSLRHFQLNFYQLVTFLLTLTTLANDSHSAITDQPDIALLKCLHKLGFLTLLYTRRLLDPCSAKII